MFRNRRLQGCGWVAAPAKRPEELLEATVELWEALQVATEAAPAKEAKAGEQEGP
jgi:hypothetical protein